MKRGYLASSLILTVSAWAFSMQGCNPGQTLAAPPAGAGDEGVGGDVTGNGGNGGAGTTGGSTSNTANGGGNPNGGAAQGGSPTGGNGNPVTTGGVPGSPTGGRPNANTGGNPPVATGGYRPATGGTNSVNPPTGGMPPVATGGMIGVATGGTPVGPATGGTPAVGNTGKTVTFSNSGKTSGAMTGWCFVAMGTADSVTQPTCGSPPVAITSTAKCTTTTNWPTAGVCVTGSVPPNPSPYDSFGINIGCNSADPATGGLGQTFSTVAITATGAPAGATFRAIISVGAIDYCAVATIGTAVAFSTFNTKCWDGTGTNYAGTGADITGVQLQIQPPTTGTTQVTNMCLTGITFGP